MPVIITNFTFYILFEWESTFLLKIYTNFSNHSTNFIKTSGKDTKSKVTFVRWQIAPIKMVKFNKNNYL